ncbi:CoA-binding protein [Candidatus Bathyarchaeota archaeon]|nr:MAG: CoA-binding protein [Candidatus Bathyarchaeota archaeon]
MSSPSRCSIHSSRAYDPRASARSARSIFLATGQQGRAEASTTSQVHGPSTTTSPREILKKYDVIAVVGASKNPEKEAYTVPAYMKEHGYMIVPVNPTADEILGEKAYKSLMDLPPDLAKKVDIVDVFRPSEELPQVAQQVIEMRKKYGRPFAFWAQLGLENEEAKKMLSQSKIPYVMNACLRVVHKLL